MAQRRKRGKSRIKATAEIVGRKIGELADRLGALKARRPDPVKAAASVRRRSAELIKNATRSANAAIKRAKAAVGRTPTTPTSAASAKRRRKTVKGVWVVTAARKAQPRTIASTAGATRNVSSDPSARRRAHTAAQGRRRQARRDRKA